MFRHYPVTEKVWQRIPVFPAGNCPDRAAIGLEMRANQSAIRGNRGGDSAKSQA
jgi:hypothetical protein